MKCFRGRQEGGAAVEYVIVSTFATLLAVAAIAFVGSVVKDKVKTMEQKLGIQFDEDSLNLLDAK